MKIGLALAGGGIKGAGHIGVIKALEENGIKVSAVAGVSIGSIVATLYSIGYTPEEMMKLFKYFAKNILKADPKYLVSNIRNTKSILGTGIISGEVIEDVIQECAKLKSISKIQDIQMPIAIPTVDIITGKEYIFTNKINYTKQIPNGKSGMEKYVSNITHESKRYINNIEIGKVVRASCSYPVLFAPLNYDKYSFLDGGILNNVPTEELKHLGVDKIITVKFAPSSIEYPKTALEVVFRAMDIMVNERDTNKSKISDYVINLHINSSSIFDIKKINDCYEIGYQKTIQEINKIKYVIEK